MALLLRPKRIFLLNPKPYLAHLLSSSSSAASGNPHPPSRRQPASSPPTPLSKLFMVNKAENSQGSGIGGSGGTSSGAEPGSSVRSKEVETTVSDELMDFLRKIPESDEKGNGVRGDGIVKRQIVKDGVGDFRNSLQKKIEILRGEEVGSDEVEKGRKNERKGKRVQNLERVNWDVELGEVLEKNGSVELKGLEEIYWDEELGNVAEKKRTEAEVEIDVKVESCDGDVKSRNSGLNGEKGEADLQAKKRMYLERMKAEWKMLGNSNTSTVVKKIEKEKEMSVELSDLKEEEANGSIAESQKVEKKKRKRRPTSKKRDETIENAHAGEKEKKDMIAELSKTGEEENMDGSEELANVKEDDTKILCTGSEKGDEMDLKVEEAEPKILGGHLPSTDSGDILCIVGEEKNASKDKTTTTTAMLENVKIKLKTASKFFFGNGKAGFQKSQYWNSDKSNREKVANVDEVLNEESGAEKKQQNGSACSQELEDSLQKLHNAMLEETKHVRSASNEVMKESLQKLEALVLGEKKVMNESLQKLEALVLEEKKRIQSYCDKSVSRSLKKLEKAMQDEKQLIEATYNKNSTDGS